MDKNGGSRLLQMKEKFQQKQMAEREMKIASLYESQQARALDRVRQSPTSTAAASPPPSHPQAHVAPGKVRQMFEERRTKAGIDKSYPLQPIHNTERPPPRRNFINGNIKTVATANVAAVKQTAEKRTIRAQVTTKTTSSFRKHQKILNDVTGSGDLNHNHEPDLNADVKTQAPYHANGYQDGVDGNIRALHNYRLEDETFPEALAPIPTPRTPEPPSPEPIKPPRRNSDKKNSIAKPNNPAAAPRRSTKDDVVTDNKAQRVMQGAAKPIPRRSPLGPSGLKTRSTTAAVASPSTETRKANEGLECTICGRRFAQDRIQKHEEICKKANTAKKRKPFDALKHRLVGTEAEPFINKLRKTAANNSQPSKKNLNSNWRLKHEEFIKAIRAAKQVQAHLDAGGKLSDLPPPPPSENPDYVQCPHCSRRFNQGAAERHIPKCANFQFNKTKPQSQAGRRR